METERGFARSKRAIGRSVQSGKFYVTENNAPTLPGATLDINWKVGWQYNKTTNIVTDSLGNPVPGTIVTGGSIERSYLSLPPVLFFKVIQE